MTEAKAVAADALQTWRERPYDELTRLVDGDEWELHTGPSGVEYQVQVHAVWNDGRSGRNLRVLAAADDGSLRSSVRPAVQDFIVTPAGDFIGEA